MSVYNIQKGVREGQTATGMRRLGVPEALLATTWGAGPGREVCLIGSVRGFERGKPNARSWEVGGASGILDGCL